MDLGMLPRLNKCCCCVSLLTGSLVVGYSSIFMAALSLSAISLSLYKVVEYVTTYENQEDPTGHSPEEVAKVAMSLYISHAYFILVLLYYLVISLILVVGLHRDSLKMVRSYVYAALLLLVLGLALVVVTSVFFGVIASIPLLKWCVLLFYCILVVRSMYLEMDEKEKSRQVFEMENLYYG